MLLDATPGRADPRQATATLNRAGTAAKNELLYQHGINFNDLPAWQRRGIGLYWQTFDKTGVNPQLRAGVTARRRRLHVDDDLPIKDDYRRLIAMILSTDQTL
ncbi:MAG TPA: hypothetical protein VMV92_23930 [Streptosporangiaceae bacterium]|nr:hypothetical protein [Streptosporangiaceae bacterium]